MAADTQATRRMNEEMGEFLIFRCGHCGQMNHVPLEPGELEQWEPTGFCGICLERLLGIHAPGRAVGDRAPV